MQKQKSSNPLRALKPVNLDFCSMLGGQPRVSSQGLTVSTDIEN